MSALPYFKAQGSSVETLSNAIDAIASHEWIEFQYFVTIHNLENEGRDLLIKEANKLRVKGRSWKPKPDSALNKQLTQALNEKASPEDSLYRRVCIEGGSVYPALIIALICNNRDNGTLKAKSKLKSKSKSKQQLEEGIEDAVEEEVVEDVNNEDDGKLKSKVILEDELKLWPTVFFKALVKRLMTIAAPPKIRAWRDIQDEELKKRKIGEDADADEDEDEEEHEDGSILVLKDLIKKLMKIFENEDELHSRKRRRIESHRDSPSTNTQLVQTLIGVVGSRTEDNPQAQLYLHGELQEAGYEIFKLSVAELNECLIQFIKPDRRCHAEKLGSSPESPVRVDPLEQKAGIFLMFRGQTAKNLAKRAVPAATSKDPQFSLPFTNVCDHVLELVERKEEEFDMVYCQGFATFVISPDYELSTFLMGFKMIKAYIKRARGQAQEKHVGFGKTMLN